MIVRRSLCALLLVATLSGAACGIKGPLRLPPPKTDTGAAPQSAPSAPGTSNEPAPARTAPEPGTSTEPRK